MSALVLLGVALAGCREENPTGGDDRGDTFAVRMVPGTVMTFDHWLLDRFGSRIPGSQTTRTWRVVADSIDAFGFGDVVVVVDSMGVGHTDSLLFRFSPPGDVYAHGYLARLIERREGRIIPAGWDRVAAFSLQPPVSWSVGFVDSSRTLTATGETSGEVLFFEVLVDGVRSAIPARQADISKSNLLATLWMTATPSVVVRLREEQLITSEQVGGELSELVGVTTAAR
jgi:hypothetical protein